jgi:ribosomal protein S6
MTNYEVMFVIDPALEEEKKDATVEMVKEIIGNGGVVGDVDVWGTRKLAYPIEKKNEGYYVVMQFQAETDMPKELDRRLKISDNVMRHIIINKDAK